MPSMYFLLIILDHWVAQRQNRVIYFSGGKKKLPRRASYAKITKQMGRGILFLCLC